MTALSSSHSFKLIWQKVHEGIRLTPDEGLLLLQEFDEESVGKLADSCRQKKAGPIVYYATTLYIHPTNLCELSCPMCSFYAKPGMKKAWFLTPEQIAKRVEKAHREMQCSEVHIVGGLWRECDLSYYRDVFSRIKAIDANLHIKALTPVEYDFLAKLHQISIEEVFQKMKSWGLGSLPGGGAEILVEAIRRQIAPQKITSDEYLSIHKQAHLCGLPSNITMLFGHVENNEDIITHLCRIRELQDETQGFQTFVPLKYHTENNALGKRSSRLKPKDIRRIYAVSRLMLDNIRNIKVLWNYVGIEEALSILNCGANDLSSTNTEEQIIQMAGGIRLNMTKDKLDSLIRKSGRIPKQIHSGYDYSQDDAC